MNKIKSNKQKENLQTAMYFELTDFISGLTHKLELKRIYYCFGCRQLINYKNVDERQAHQASGHELKTWRQARSELWDKGIEDPLLGKVCYLRKET